MLDKRYIGFIAEENVIADVVGVNFRDGVIVLQSADNEVYVVSQDAVELLKEAFVLHDKVVFDKDVLGSIEGKLYQVELFADGEVRLHTLNERLESASVGHKFNPSKEVCEQLEKVLDIAGSIYELQEQVDERLDFNIAIVKDFDGEHYTYFYACNNLETNEIDLIKVVFVGHKLLKEESYERRTLSHEVYLDSLDAGTLKEVSPQELMSFATGTLYNNQEEEGLYDDREDVYEDEEEEFECGVDCGCFDECELQEEVVEKKEEDDEEDLW